MDNVWARFLFFFFFCILLENYLLKVSKTLGLTFLKARKYLEGLKTAFFRLLYGWVCCWMDCLQLPFIRLEEGVSWTRFLTRAFTSKKKKKNFIYNKQIWKQMIAEFLLTFQVNRKRNATGRRRLNSSNQAAIFVSTSCEERHNKPFWL